MAYIHKKTYTSEGVPHENPYKQDSARKYGKKGSASPHLKTHKKGGFVSTETADAKPKQNLSNLQMLYAAGGVIEASSIAVGAMAKASAIRAKGKYEEAGFIENAKRLQRAAEDAKKRGDKAVHQHLQNVRKLVGSQRAALAASGVEIDSGNAKDIQLETLDLGMEDASTIRTNAFLEAHGYRRQASELEHQAKVSRIGRKARERATLLSGRLKVVQSVANTGIQMNKAGSA